jgi:sensor domain CHASE-containing protein
MINGVFIINNQGKPRLAKFYEYLVRLRLPPQRCRCLCFLSAPRPTL